MSDDNGIWGNDCLPIVLEALGKSGHDIKGVSLHFECGVFATATFTDRSGQETTEPLPIYHLDDAPVLGTPKGLNAMTLDIFEESIVTIECRYFPLSAKPIDIVTILKEWEFQSTPYLPEATDDLVLRKPVVSPPPDVTILRDETGQPWAISVRPDGQLQTAKYPDGEPITMTMWANKAIADALESAGEPAPEVARQVRDRLEECLHQ